jgi:MFS family permease
MDTRNRIGLYGSYFLGMAGIGFTLPYLPLYLGQRGLSDSAIGIISTLAALTSLAQFPAGLWSDRLGSRKPFLVVALAVVAVSSWLLRGAEGTIWVGLLVILFAENGIGRAVVESLSGAEAAALAPKGSVGAALGALRFWKPIGIVLMALIGSWVSEKYGVGAILLPIAIIQSLAVVAALLIHEPETTVSTRLTNGDRAVRLQECEQRIATRWFAKDAGLWAFVAAMVMFHAANAPGGVYLGLFLKRDLHAPDRMLAYAFVVSMVAWMLVVWPAGWLADRCGRKPLLIAGWTIMAGRLGLVSVVQSPMLAVANQALDGLGNGLFAVMAAAWVTDRLADPRRAGEAQVLVGSCLVLGSALGPAAAAVLVGPLGYRGLFAALAALGAVATVIVVFLVPETLAKHEELIDGRMVEPMATTSELSVVP